MNRPIFIVGPPRSGTTLTAQILGRHSKIFMPGETHFFHDVYARRIMLGNPDTDAGIENIVQRLKSLYARYNEPKDQERIDRLFTDQDIGKSFRVRCRNYSDVMSHFMEVQMKAEGKERWGNHTPKDLFHVDEIMNYYPHAKIIVCVRDVRDFLVSYRDKWRATTEYHVERIRKLYHPLLTSILWKTCIRQIQRIQGRISPENLVIVKYEDLVSETERVVRELCSYIGETFERQMLDVTSHNSSTAVDTGGIFTSSVGRWENTLGKEDAYVAQYIAGREMELMGYKRKHVDVNAVKLAWLIATTPVAVARALNANREHRGPLLPYLLRRAASYTSKGCPADAGSRSGSA